ncbi:hypothetical protein Tcan_06279 [Toxocara canis]|uniref:Uncharacterized protein n=1 Tax=Toxocara canis TaxID=6265 RepID=A0A0B2UL58_TOXCA|nr:hypothetical protein Tcan_06279 [Toxocara canis]
MLLHRKCSAYINDEDAAFTSRRMQAIKHRRHHYEGQTKLSKCCERLSLLVNTAPLTQHPRNTSVSLNAQQTPVRHPQTNVRRRQISPAEQKNPNPHQLPHTTSFMLAHLVRPNAAEFSGSMTAHRVVNADEPTDG